MKITEELVKSGYITINRTDEDSLKSVKAYNNYASRCRDMMKRIKAVKHGINVLNPLAILIICVFYGGNIFRSKALALIIFLIVIGAFIYSYNKRYIVYAIASTLLLILDLWFAGLVLANITLTWWTEYMEGALRKEVGYPEFGTIHITFDESAEKR